MCNVGRCFICLTSIMVGRAVQAKSRTAVPVWVSRKLCTVCANRVRELGEQLINSQSEWHTVRLGSVEEDILGVFER